jgi:FPC/CPF motif-containing protein YcgG
MSLHTNEIINRYRAYLAEKDFPCVAGKAALAADQIHVMVADHLACPKDDAVIMNFLCGFIDAYQHANTLYHSAAIIFKEPGQCDEVIFDSMLWNRLQAIADLDASLHHPWDHRVNNDPASPDFSYSLNGEAMYIIGLHPGSSRKSRQFDYPTLVFNPHSQFEKLRERQKYNAMREAIRKRDTIISGSVNPMLTDFGEASEVWQYSGRQYDKDWQCPFKSNHEKK